MGVRPACLGVAVALLGALLSAPATSAAPAPQAEQRVEITAERTETAQVYQEPDGSRTLEQHLRPVRARTATGWQPLDLTLRRAPDGSIAPVAATKPLRFSGGGTGSLVRFGKPGASFELGWPDPLPAPVLSGPTATYPGVLPGVDLQVTARDSGFTHLLVVHTREAARHPRLAKIAFRTSSDGLDLSVRPDGGLNANDRSGQTVFRSPPATMWDSRSAAGVGQECRRPIRVQVARNSLSVQPDQGMLADPATRFPVRIDPGWDGEPGSWGLVYGTPSDFRDNVCFGGDGDGIAKSGFSNWDGPTVLVRSFFQYSVAALKRPVGQPPVAIRGASFDAFQSYAPSCQARVVDLWQSAEPYEPWTTWNNQPPTKRLLGTQDVARGYSAACPADWIGFDVRAAAQDAVDGNGLVTLMMRAGNEGDRMAWRKFHPNPKLIINYNTPPERPVALNASGLPCAVQPGEPHLPITTPQLNATAHDPDGGTVAAEFEWWQRGERLVGSFRTATQHSGSPFSVTIPAGDFRDGSRIGWRVRTFDGELHGPWSEWCDLTVDQTKPGTAPTITSTDYPADRSAGGIGKTGRFTLSAPGEADIARYEFELENTARRKAEAVEGKVVVAVTPPRDGPMTLKVWAYDKAGNESPPGLYRIFVRSTQFPPVQHWRLDGKLPSTTVPDALGRGSTGSFTQGPVSWTGGRIGDALQFDGRSGQVGLGPKSTVHTGDSFSVSAWVKLDRLDGPWQTFVSQDAEHASSFYLQYRSDIRRFAFTMPEEDRHNFGEERATADVPVRQGVWTHLVGVYDPGAEQTLRIYVDGRFAGDHKHVNRWHKNGEVRIGRGKYNGAPVDFLTGAVDDVRIYDRVLGDGRLTPADRVKDGSDVHILANSWPAEAGLYTAETSGGGQGGDSSGNYRHATAQPGAGSAPGRLGNAFQLDGARGHLSTVDPAVRTDTSFTVSAWVKAEPGADSMTAVSQDGTRASGFALGYDGAARNWVFGMHHKDSDGAVLERSVYGKALFPGVWTHLAGRYDAAAEEVQLFVNGDPAPPGRLRADWTAGGGLVIGRGKANGAPANHWRGEVDEVRIAAGLRTRNQLEEETERPQVIRPLVRDGLNRYYGHNRDHFTTGGAGPGGQAPPGYHLEHELGWFAPDGAPNTVVLRSCRTGENQFTSVEADCEGFRTLATLGPIYRTPPAGEATVPLMRCRTEGGEHFESVHADCEGKRVEFRLGYMRAYAPLVRHLQQDGPGDHLSETGGVPTGYRGEWRLGILPTTPQPGTKALESCVDGTDAFSSVAADCEGKTKLRTLGWIYPEPPAGLPAVKLSRCKQASGERFDTTDPGCEGQQLDAVLGYLLTRL